MMKADEAKRITNEVINRSMENFFTKAEKEIRKNAEKGQTICYIFIPQAFQCSENKIIDTLREYGYGVTIDYDRMKITW